MNGPLPVFNVVIGAYLSKNFWKDGVAFKSKNIIVGIANDEQAKLRWV